MYPMTEEEKKWRGRSDARILAEAEEIKRDNERLSTAKKEAKDMLDEKSSELTGLKKVVGKTTSKTTTTKDRSGITRNTFHPDGFPKF